MSSKNIKTVAVHAGSRISGSRAEGIAPPLHLAAVSYFDDAGALDRSLDGKDFVYARISSQNVVLLEEAVAALEGAEACVAFASGMAALRAVLDAQPLASGDCVVMPADGYGATRALFKSSLARRGVELHPLILSEPEALQRIERLRPKFVLAESITNPLLSVPDLPALSAICHRAGALLAVDATFASPVLQQAHRLGADYAVQSTTKWINGHSDAMGGTVSGSASRIEPLRAARVQEGGILGPFEAWLTLRGIRTLPIRIKSHCEHAIQVAKRLVQSPLLDRVLYPGLPTHPNHATAQKLLGPGFGGMLAFEIKGADRAQAFRFLESVELCKPAPSLGDVTTLVMHPATASARRLTPQEREAAGIKENLIRVSVGLEDPEDISGDLLRAVARAAGQ
jgi:cystathionine gamma-synthase/methionine-gamma-lyase